MTLTDILGTHETVSLPEPDNLSVHQVMSGRVVEGGEGVGPFVGLAHLVPEVVVYFVLPFCAVDVGTSVLLVQLLDDLPGQHFPVLCSRHIQARGRRQQGQRMRT